MYILMANPESFEVQELSESPSGREEFKIHHKATPPPNNNVYHLIEVQTIEGLNFDQIMEMMYSSDPETKTMLDDMLATYTGDDTAGVEEN